MRNTTRTIKGIRPVSDSTKLLNGVDAVICNARHVVTVSAEQAHDHLLVDDVVLGKQHTEGRGRRCHSRRARSVRCGAGTRSEQRRSSGGCSPPARAGAPREFTT